MCHVNAQLGAVKDLFSRHKRNTEEDNTGYIVFE
jgi:hypothetical protein